MSKKPGVMIYFELLYMLKRMSLEEAGQLFIAILEYGETRRVPELTGALFVMWPIIQSRLDFDNQRYIDKAIQARYAADVRWAKEQNREVIPFEQWVAEEKNKYMIDELYES